MRALIAYMLGVASLLASDIIVTSNLSNVEIALWADMRALFGILAAIVTLGLEMVIIRSPGASRLILRLVLVQGVVLSVPLGFIVHQLGYLSSPWSAIILASGAAFSIAQGQYFRSHSAFLYSQLTQQGWRFVILTLLVSVIFFGQSTTVPIDLWAAGSIFAVSLVGWALVLAAPRELEDEAPEIRKHFSIAFRFLLTNIILHVALFGEQMIVNGFGTADQASIYFTHLTYFLQPVSILSAFVGFRIGPWVRDNRDGFDSILSRQRLLIHAGIISAVAMTQAIGWIGWQVIGPSVGEPDSFLMTVFFISAILRTYYIIPSTYNGIFGAPNEHDLLIIAQLLVLFGLSVGLYVFYPSTSIIPLVALAGAANWIARTAVSFAIMKFIKKRLIASKE